MGSLFYNTGLLHNIFYLLPLLLMFRGQNIIPKPCCRWCVAKTSRILFLFAQGHLLQMTRPLLPTPLSNQQQQIQDLQPLPVRQAATAAGEPQNREFRLACKMTVNQPLWCGA